MIYHIEAYNTDYDNKLCSVYINFAFYHPGYVS